MFESFRCFCLKQPLHGRHGRAAKARELLGAQAASLQLERLEFLLGWITVFHAGNIGAVR